MRCGKVPALSPTSIFAKSMTRATPPTRCTTKPSPGWRRSSAATCRCIGTTASSVHFTETGKIELQLDDQHYSVQAPLFILTPPSVPHAFFTEPDSDGHVLTVRRELIWPLLSACIPAATALDMPGICLSLADAPQELTALSHYWALIRREFGQNGRARTDAGAAGAGGVHAAAAQHRAGRQRQQRRARRTAAVSAVQQDGGRAFSRAPRAGYAQALG